jgi:hypothetical protein
MTDTTDTGGELGGFGALSDTPGQTQEQQEQTGAYVTTPGPGAQQTEEPTAQTQAQTAPENYDGLTMPEGYEEDPTLMSDARTLFGELELTQEQAQALVDFAAKKKIVGGMANEQELWQKQVDEWTKQIKTDPEVGGLKLSENLGLARKGVDKLGGKALLDALDSTGAGVHPVIFKAFVRLGRMLSEDRFAAGRASPPPGAETPEEKARQVYGRIM